MTDTTRAKQAVQRRPVLGVLSAGAAAVAAVSRVAVPRAKAMVPPDNKGGSHYRESEHIKQYYRVNRY